MKKDKERILTVSHFSLLGFAFMNALIHEFSGIGLISFFDNGVKIILSLSGIILFFLQPKSWLWKKYYYSSYLLLLLVPFLGFLFKSLFLGIITIIILMPFNLNEKEYEKDNILIYDTGLSQGLMSMCCTYELTERKFIIFEKDLGVISTDDIIDFNNLELSMRGDSIELTFSYERETDKITRVLKRTG